MRRASFERVSELTRTVGEGAHDLSNGRGAAWLDLVLVAILKVNRKLQLGLQLVLHHEVEHDLDLVAAHEQVVVRRRHVYGKEVVGQRRCATARVCARVYVCVCAGNISADASSSAGVWLRT